MVLIDNGPQLIAVNESGQCIVGGLKGDFPLCFDAVADIQNDADHPAQGAVGVVENRLVEINLVLLAVRKPESGFVGLSALALEKLLIFFVVDAGKMRRIEIEHRLPDDVSFVDAEHLAKRRIAAQITALRIFIENGKRNGMDQGFGQLRIAEKRLIIRHGFVPGLQWP